MGVLSTSAIEKEIDYLLEQANGNILEIFDDINALTMSLNEAEYEKVTQKLKLEILDIDRFVRVNDVKQVTNPRAFSKANIPSDDGILSNVIFGTSGEERKNIFGYIGLNGYFMDPSCYKTWCKVDKNLKACIHGTMNFSISDKGILTPDPVGKTGIEFIRKNLSKINFAGTGSLKRDINIKYLEANRDKIFINKYLVIPPYYRDKNTSTNASRVVGLSGVNKLYTDLIVATNALTATQDYMFDATDAMNGRVQELILALYNWFSGAQSASISEANPQGIQGKFGIMKRANQTKTANYSSRLVISAPELKVYNPEQMKVNFDQSAMPLAACIADFKDFIIFHTRRFFDNEFRGIETYQVVDKKGNAMYRELEAPEIYFSDDRIEQEMERFLHGYINRFIPIEVPVKQDKATYYLQFKGRYGDGTNPEILYQRRLTWCDVFFMAAVEATKDKHLLITRFPIDAYTNQVSTKIVVSSTKKTEPMIVEGTYYKYYPMIREEDIGTDTTNKFVDTFNMSNLYLEGMGGDYDGDQVTVKGVYTEEANQELEEFMNSKQNFINFGGKPSRTSTNDAIQSLFGLTNIIGDTKLTNTISFS